MAQTLIEFDCPCCGERLEIDTRSGKVRRLRTDQGLDDLMKKQKGETRRLDDLFDRATHDTKTEKDRFDDLLDEAKRKATEDDDGPDPRRPFDLD